MNDSKERLVEISKILAKYDIVHGVNPEKLKSILEELGPTFIKLGQIMSMRTDMLPESYCKELTKLRTDVKPMTKEEIEKVLTNAYGQNPFDNFEKFNEKPLGSASIAQVHKAKLTNGEVVVIKIQRPGIVEVMTRDMRLLRKATGVLSFVNVGGGALDFNTILEEMWKVSQEELDFLHEVRNAQEFYKLNNDDKFVTCPRVYPCISTSQVIVMEYVDGIQIDDIRKLKSLGYDVKSLGNRLAENYGKQILDDGFFHADPHPGNIKIRDEKIVWIDMGMMGRLSMRDRQILKKTVVAIVQKDASDIKDILLTVGDYKGRINHPRLLEDIDELLIKYVDADMESINLGELLEAILNVANNHNITMPKGISMFSRGLMTIQGVVLLLNPEVSIIDIMAMQMSKDIFSEFSFMNGAKDKTKSLIFSSRKAMNIPTYISDLLKMTVRGQSKINIEITGSEEPLKKIDNMVNKIIICILISALLISSSLLHNMQFGINKMAITIIGISEFLIALFLGIYLIFCIINKNV